MKNIPNLDYRFDDLMHSIIELCIASREPAKIAFVCLPGDDGRIKSKIESFMRGKRYGVAHYTSSRRDPVLYFENKSGISILSYEDDWLGSSFTEMIMFCRLDEMDTDTTSLCLRSCVYSSKPMIFSLLSKRYNESVTLKEIYDREQENT
jgi:hypothetical protein